MVIDQSNLINVLENFPQQCKTALGLAKGISVTGKIDKIVIAGMGGSSVGGDLLKLYMHNSKIPVFVVRDYKVPNYVDENTLLFAVSYSGNTEETIAAYQDAVKKKAKIVAVTSGGQLSVMSKRVIKIPSGLQPRAALGYLFFPLLGVVSNSKIIDVDEREIKETLGILSKTDDFKKKGEELANKIKNRTPIIYASDLFGPVAYRCKTQFNENSKVHAFTHTFSEMNHNEILGYTTASREKFIAIYIRDNEDHERIKKRFEIIKEIISQKVDVEEIQTKGSSLLARMFSGIYYGDFASYYLALLNRIDPTPVEVIEDLKRKLRD